MDQPWEPETRMRTARFSKPFGDEGASSAEAALSGRYEILQHLGQVGFSGSVY